MRQTSGFLNQLAGVVRVAHSQLCFDVGSANTRVQYQGKLVYNQPSCATFHEESTSIVQLGQPALVAADRSPGALTTLFPIRQGYITDLTRVKAYVSAVINQALQAAEQRVVVTLSGKYAIPSDLSPVEKQMLERVLKQAGLSRVELIPKPKAIWHSLKTKQALSSHMCIIDIGSHTTDVGLFAGQECRALRTIYIGSDSFTQKIKELVRAECQAAVGWPTAEKLKLQQKNMLFEANPKDESTIAIRAKSLLSLSPTTVFLKKTSLQKAFLSVAGELVDELTSFFALQEPELVTPALEQGIYITGGGSQLAGLVLYLEQHLKTQAIRSAKPQEDVVRGLAEL